MKLVSLALSGLLALTAGLLTIFRDRLITSTFGITPDTDAFYLCLTWVLFFTGIAASLAGSVLMPMLVKSDNPPALRTQALWLHAGVSAAIAALFAVALWAAPDLYRPYGLILVPVIVLSSFYVVGLASLNAASAYLLPQFLLLLPPGITIAFLLLAGPQATVQTPAIGFAAGYAAMALACMGAALWKKLRLAPAMPDVKGAIQRIVLEYRWIIMGVALMASNSAVDHTMALFLAGDGGVTSLTLGARITSFLTGIGSAAFSGILISQFSHLLKQGDEAGLRRARRLYEILFLAASALAAIVIMVFSDEIVRLLFGADLVGPAQLETISAIQMAYAGQLPFYMAGILLAYIINARGDNRILARVGTENFILNIALNAVLGSLYGPVGIAASTSLVYAYSYARLRALTAG